ncbi:MAG: GAF domain-containing protein, partial [Myxococcaceae bacterium]|nr:GAF domain-containing protein [Myxococcaceae bacterium]
MAGELFRTLFDRAPVALVVLDVARGAVTPVHANAKFRVMFDGVPDAALSLSKHAPSTLAHRFTLRDGEHADLTVTATSLDAGHVMLSFADGAAAVRLAALAESSQEFNLATGDVRELLELVTKRLGERLDAFATVRLISRDGLSLEIGGSTWHRDPTLAAAARQLVLDSPQRLGEGMSGRVAQTGEAMLIPKLDPEVVAALTAERLRPVVLSLGLTSGLAVPLRARSRIIGVLSLGRGRDGASFTQDDVRLAQDLADRAGLAVENALLLADLEQRVQQRTAELTEANRELEAFSYSVSHDLRAPLRSIEGFSSVLEEEQSERLDEGGKDALARVRRAAKRMTQIIDDLLKLSRIHTVQMVTRSVDLSRLAGTIVEELRAGEPDRDV